MKPGLPPPPMGWVARLLASLVAVILGIGVFMFSLVIFAVVVTLGLGFGLYVWWKTRAVRRSLREQMAQASRTGQPEPVSADAVIEGEYVRLDEAGRQIPPRDE